MTALPPQARKELERAVALLQRGQLATAESICAELLARFPDDPELLHFGGVLANRMGRHDRAVERLSRLEQSQPPKPRALAALGVAYERLDRFDEARRAFGAALQADPGFSEAHNGLGVALYREGRVPQSIASFDAAIARDAGSVEARLNRARALRALGRDAEAIRSWQEALALAPGRDDVRRASALGFLEAGERTLGIREVRQLLERSPKDSLARSQLALALDAEGQHDEALQEMETAVGAGEVEPRVRNAHALLLMRAGRWEEARAALALALVAEPTSGETRLNMALAVRGLGRRDEALSLMREAEPLLDGHGLAELAAMYGQMGEVQRSAELARRAIARSPGLAQAHATLGVELLRSGDLEAGWREYVFRPTRGSAAIEKTLAGEYPPRLPDRLEGRDIVIRAEQGLGDVLFFLRYAVPLARAGARLHFFKVDPRLHPMLGRAIPGAFAEEPGQLPPQALTLWAGDLPVFVRPLTGRDVEPTLRIPALDERVARMRERLGGGGDLVGIAWRAGTAPRAGPVGQKLLSKDIDLDTFGASLANVKRRWVAVQRNPGAGEIEALSRMLGREVIDASGANDDLEELLALMSILDDYVGVSSTSVHLRLAAGRGGKVLVPFPPDWRWQLAGDSPFFPGFATYREEGAGGWGSALDRLRSDLQKGTPAP